VKKLIAIFFLLNYTFTAVGATVHMHYCMGNFVEWSLKENKERKCGKCGMKETANKKGCCKDEQKEFKLKIDQQKSSIADVIKVMGSAAHITPTPSYTTYIQKPIANFNYSNYRPPPNIQNQNLQVLYCTFLI
jgi:hypothetical protein